jgi:hypothetical protein
MKSLLALLSAAILAIPPAKAAITATYSVSTAWDTGYTANLVLANTSSTPVTSWNASLSTPDKISSIWNATAAAVTGGYQITPASWNTSIPANGTVSVGFNFNASKPASPTKVLVNGIQVPLVVNNPYGSPTPTPAPTRRTARKSEPQQQVVDRHALEGALDALARAARGSARDALSLTDQAIAFGGGSVSGQAVAQMLGQVGREPLIRLMQALMESRAQDALAMGDELLESGASAEAVLDELARLCHEVIVARVLGSQASASQDEDVQALAKKLDAEQAQMAYQIVILGRRDLDLAPDESTGFQMTLMRLLAFAPEPLPPPAAALRAPRTRAAALAKTRAACPTT